MIATRLACPTTATCTYWLQTGTNVQDCPQPDPHTSQPVPSFYCSVPTTWKKCMLFVLFCHTDLYRYSFFHSSPTTMEPISSTYCHSPALGQLQGRLGLSALDIKTHIFYWFLSSSFIHHLTLSCIVTVHQYSRGALHFLERRRIKNHFKCQNMCKMILKYRY